MSVHLSPIGNAAQFFNTNGRPLNGGLLYTYAAGTSTPQTTYSDSAGGTPNANPIVLAADGRVTNEVWLTDGLAYKFVLKDSGGSILGTYDNLTGIGDPALGANLAASGGSALVDFLQSGTGAAARTVQSRLRDTVSVKDFGAVGDGSTNDTAAIQAAVNTGKAVYFPVGTYKITTAITVSTIGQLLYGAAMELTVIAPSGAIKGIVSSGALVRFNLRDLSIIGGNTTLDAIDVSSGLFYESNWQNLTIFTGGRAIYAPTEFANTFQNIHFNSYNDHGIEIQGDVCTTLIGCYAHSVVTSGKVGYRVYAGGTFVGCNGLDAGNSWGMFGRAIAKGDPSDVQYKVVFIGCNFEDFKVEGIRFRYNGNATFLMCQFVPPTAAVSANYTCSVYIEFCDQLIEFHQTGTTSKGSVRTKLADVFSDAGTAPISFSSYTTWDDNATLTSIGNFSTSLAEFSVFGVNISKLVMGRGYGFYSPVNTQWTANAATFSVANIDRVKTANSAPTTLNAATGGVDGQMLVINVRDANTTIKHVSGVTGEFFNKSGADIVATNGQPYVYMANGGIWQQI